MRTPTFLCLFLFIPVLLSCNTDSGLFDAEEQMDMEIEQFQAYFAANNLNPQFHNRGLFYLIQEEGAGRIPTSGNTLVVHYKGYFLDGTVFDTSIEQVARDAGLYNPGRTYNPFQFRFKQGAVIQGWDIGFEFLKEGGKATFFVTSALGYGNRAVGSIPANTPLIFDVELLEVRP
jgi:FKBP-type peptidyl-prolyl cis-trans isomerase